MKNILFLIFLIGNIFVKCLIDAVEIEPGPGKLYSGPEPTSTSKVNLFMIIFSKSACCKINKIAES